MTARRLPSVWFERQIIPELVPEVVARVTIVGPAVGESENALEGAIGIVAGARRYDAALMSRAPKLRVIARTGIGYDRVDIDEATRRGIAVCNTPDAPTISTAEHAAALMLMVAKNVKRAESALRAGLDANHYVRHEAIELDGKILGVVGFGRIGRHVAGICAGFGMSIIAFDPLLPADAFPPGVRRIESLAELLGAADVVSLHLPLTDASRGLIGADEFALMKPGAVFINAARGGLVDTDALIHALDSGVLFGAGLDVTDPEPLPPGHPLLARDDVIVTPHVASATADGKIRIFRSALEQAIAVIEGRRPEHLVNPEVWDALTARVPVSASAGEGR
jgi:D-3-phosphoglycerate dehydrogenase / 2-oxoglutarate reductase